MNLPPLTTPKISIEELVQDIQNPRLRNLILNHKNIKHIMQNNHEQSKKAHLEQLKDNQEYLKQYQERKWLSTKGKKYLIDFNNEERKEMKHYFNSLDQKKTGSIGIDQLQEFLLSVGLFQTREEIKSLIDSVDQDSSGKIQFGEFLSMIKNDQGQNEQIVTFFKTVIGGKANLSTTTNSKKHLKYIPKKKYQKSSITEDVPKKYPYPKGLSFEMVVSHIRRKHMMTALNITKSHTKLNKSEKSSHSLNPSQNNENSVDQIAKGQQVMQSLQRMYERKLIRQIKEAKRSQLEQTTKRLKESNGLKVTR